MTAADTGTGDEVGVGGQVLGVEDLIAGLDHSGIIDIDILDEEPGAQTVDGQCATVLHESEQVIVQQQAGLVFGRFSGLDAVACPEMGVAVVGKSGQSARKGAGDDTGLQIDPQGYFGAVQRRLFHDGAGTGRIFRQRSQQTVGLIGSIAQEIPFEDGGRSFQFVFQQMVIGIEQDSQLLVESQFRTGEVNHRMVFTNSCHWNETGYFYTRMVVLFFHGHIEIRVN